MNILIVDDQASARCVLAGLLEELRDVTLHEAQSLAEARAVIERCPLDLALIDIRLSADMRNRDGLTLVRELRERTAVVPIVVTASSEMTEIRAAMRLGAFDYILKDELCEELVLPIVQEVQRLRSLEDEVQRLRARCHGGPFPKGLVGASPAMERLRATIRRVALSDRPALVLGPTGAGKEVVVQAIHALGPHPEAPLLDLNCGAIPEALIESQLFGHERGAFTGAERRQDGCFTAVGEGTLFLDEIAELPLGLQARLLRVLETGRFRRVGSLTESRFAGRVVAATHADLEDRAREGRFRQDLYFRLNVLPLRVPGLDERREDIPALLVHFVGQQRRPLRFTQAALDVLMAAEWPGHVRQLRTLVDRLVVFAEEDVITPSALGELSEVGSAAGAAQDRLRRLALDLLRLDLPDKLAAIEQALVTVAMTLSDGNKSAAARLLGVHRKVVERQLERHAAEGE